MIYGTSTSSFPDDGYGWNTDNPPTAYEIIDDAFCPKSAIISKSTRSKK